MYKYLHKEDSIFTYNNNNNNNNTNSDRTDGNTPYVVTQCD
jgi:hypothetical protein